MVRALAIDVGTSSVRTAIVDETGVVSSLFQQRLTITTPQPGEVELDADEIGRVVLELAARTLAEAGGADVVGITNQRATTVVFDPATGRAVGPTLGWQDLRTVFDCLALQEQGLRLAPNQSATKLRWLIEHAQGPAREVRFATIETWIAWLLTRGEEHVTDHSNAAITGLVDIDVTTWHEPTLTALGIDPVVLPRIVPTIGPVATAHALAGDLTISALIGDQPASLFGQCCVTHGAKITFGTGAMLNMPRGPSGPSAMTRYDSGCFPVVVRSDATSVIWGVEGIVLSAGAAVDWAVEDLGIVESAAASDLLAASVTSSGGVTFVPALSGLGTPRWDFGARGAFFGLTRGSGRAQMMRAVLEGVAQRGADLVEAALVETGNQLEEVRVDGGMTANRTFLTLLADATGLPIAVSPEREATTRGAGLMALVGAGHLRVEEVENMWHPTRVIEPTASDGVRAARRADWANAVDRAAGTIPALSEIRF
ncbi:MAG: FGGY family carbohydrate kinase [Acidimicrobiales bacterium]